MQFLYPFFFQWHLDCFHVFLILRCGALNVQFEMMFIYDEKWGHDFIIPYKYDKFGPPYFLKSQSPLHIFGIFVKIHFTVWNGLFSGLLFYFIYLCIRFFGIIILFSSLYICSMLWYQLLWYLQLYFFGLGLLWIDLQIVSDSI